SVIEVPWEEASRFGIMNTNEDMDIVEFDEKPQFPKSNLASMGIYIFKWSILKEFLEMDARNPESSNDFGKDVIPMLLEENKKLVAYPFQ
ncbi:sugar phosphate nucleotidyltransferase, partial [Methylobacterium nigriterrae]